MLFANICDTLNAAAQVLCEVHASKSVAQVPVGCMNKAHEFSGDIPTNMTVCSLCIDSIPANVTRNPHRLEFFEQAEKVNLNYLQVKMRRFDLPFSTPKVDMVSLPTLEPGNLAG